MPAAPQTYIRLPINQFIEPATGRPTQEWLLWLLNPSVYGINLSNALAPQNGGTGLSTLPSDGQLLIGNNGAYGLNTLTPGAGISVTNGPGSITLANTGVLSFSAGTTGLLPATAITGAVSLSGTLNAANGGTGLSSYAVGDLLYANSPTTLGKLADIATGNALISGGVGIAPSWGKIGLTTHVSGTLPVGNGGSGATTLTGYLKGNGVSPFTAVSSIPYADVSGLGTIVTQNLGASGTFKSADTPAKTITVTNGIITSIV